MRHRLEWENDITTIRPTPAVYGTHHPATNYRRQNAILYERRCFAINQREK